MAPSTAYDPNRLPANFKPRPVLMTLRDSGRKRDLPIRVFLPESGKAAPIVIFSHGLGGSRDMNTFLGEHLAARGYVAIFTQHIGSDTSVWQNIPVRDRMAAMRNAASYENFMLRQGDIHFLLDDLKRLNSSDAKLKGRIDLSKVGMSGHSFGAVTTQAVSGQDFPGIGQKLTDPRIDAAVAYSPSAPAAGSAARAFGIVEIPWLVMTGTKDTSLIGNATLEDRLAVFPALPPGDKYEVVLFEAEHSAFTERALPGDRLKRNPNHHKVMLGLTTAFWDAYLKGNKEAKVWLQGSGPRRIMEPKDTWKRK